MYRMLGKSHRYNQRRHTTPQPLKLLPNRKHQSATLKTITVNFFGYVFSTGYLRCTSVLISESLTYQHLMQKIQLTGNKREEQHIFKLQALHAQFQNHRIHPLSDMV